MRVCLSPEGAKNVSWPWLSLLRGWGSLTMTSTGKFVYIYIYMYIYKMKILKAEQSNRFRRKHLSQNVFECLSEQHLQICFSLFYIWLSQLLFYLSFCLFLFFLFPFLQKFILITNTNINIFRPPRC